MHHLAILRQRQTTRGVSLLVLLALWCNLLLPTLLEQLQERTEDNPLLAVCTSTGVRMLAMPAVSAWEDSHAGTQDETPAVQMAGSMHCALCQLGTAWLPGTQQTSSAPIAPTGVLNRFSLVLNPGPQHLPWTSLPARAPPALV
jgi:hypothetical protein